MKKNILLLCCSIFLFSCEEVVEINVPSGAPKLIIDAAFEVFFNETPVRANTVVKLSLSADYFDDEIPFVTNATVSLENLTTNTVIQFEDTDLDGNYLPIESFIPEDNVAYELTIIYENETYKSSTTKVKSTPIIEVVQGDKTLFTGNEIEINVTLQDDENEENYYSFDFSNNNFSLIEDRFFNGQIYDVTNFYEEGEIELPATVTIKMSGITKDYFTYFRTLQNQSGQSGGGPFQTIPSSLLGNIVNTTNSNNFPLGYFHIGETDLYELDLIEKED